MSFLVKRRLDLEFLGDDWKGAYVNFRAPSYTEVKEIAALENKQDKQGAQDNNQQDADVVINTLKDHIVDGKGYDPENQGLADITKDNFEDLPPQVISKAVELLLGDPDPKS